MKNFVKKYTSLTIVVCMIGALLGSISLKGLAEVSAQSEDLQAALTDNLNTSHANQTGELKAGSDVISVEDARIVSNQGQDSLATPNLAPDLPNFAYLGQFLKPWEHISSDERIEINFENAELTTVTKYFEEKYKVKFIFDTVIQPLPQGGKSPIGIKCSFTTHRALSPKEAWDLFLTFLDMSGLALVPGPDEWTYRLTTNVPQSQMSANKSPLPTFIGVDPSLIPDNDTKIRYVYFVKNSSLQTLSNVVEKMQSASHGPIIRVEDVNALIMTDRASNIRAILEVIKELDNVTSPETLVIMRLNKADSTAVAKLYNDLVAEERTLLQRVNPTGKKPSGASFFTENVRVFAWPQANKLFILGPRAAVARLEDFIRKEIDKESDLPYSPLHVYPLKFVGATEMATLLNDLKNYQSGSDAARVGGMLGTTRLLKPTVTISAEQSTNSLIISADYDDYLQLRDLLQKIDVEQPQVAIRVLVLDIETTDQKDFGIQFRNMNPGLTGVLGKNVNFQTSGLPFGDGTFSQIVQRTTDPITGATTSGASRLLGDLVTIAGNNVPGSTLLTLGQDIDGVWGLFKILQSVQNVQLVAKPFLVTTNKYNAHITIGQTFRVETSNVIGGADTSAQTMGDLQAALDINLTPQISPDGLVTLSITVDDSRFLDTTGQSRTDNKIVTSVILADNQVLALGGIYKDTIQETITKVPILGDVPLLGWFFKNKEKVRQKLSLLILVSATIIKSHDSTAIDKFTKGEFDRAEKLLCVMMADDQQKDPVNRLFFNDNVDPVRRRVEDFKDWSAMPSNNKEAIGHEQPLTGQDGAATQTAAQDATAPQTGTPRIRGAKRKRLSEFINEKRPKNNSEPLKGDEDLIVEEQQ